MCALRCFSHVQLFVTLWAVVCQAPLSMGFLRQEYWSGLPCLPPGDLSDPRIKPAFPVTPELQVDSLPLSHRGSPRSWLLFEKSDVPDSLWKSYKDMLFSRDAG